MQKSKQKGKKKVGFRDLVIVGEKMNWEEAERESGENDYRLVSQSVMNKGQNGTTICKVNIPGNIIEKLCTRNCLGKENIFQRLFLEQRDAKVVS